MKTNKIIALITIIAMVLSLAACSTTSETGESTTSAQETGEGLTIIATSFHEYDWVKNIIGENSDITLNFLLDTGVDMHSYQPSTQDFAEIASADMVIYNGGDSDLWVADAVAQSVNENQIVVSMMNLLGDEVLAEEYVEGMEAHSHDHDHADEDAHDHADEDAHDHADEDTHDHADEEAHDHADEETHDHADEDAHDHADETVGHDDEHIWLSLKNAEKLITLLTAQIITLDPENEATYTANSKNYLAQIDALDEEYEQMVESAANDTLIFTDRFPFRYLIEDYDINYFAAFSGCSAETEASPETIIFLADKIDELNAQNVIIIDESMQDFASTIISSSTNTNSNTLVLNSIQSVTAQQITDGTTYLSIMKENLEVLKTALS